jgi:hypothetical protein
MNETLRFDAPELRQVLGASVNGVTIVKTVDGYGKSPQNRRGRPL